MLRSDLCDYSDAYIVVKVRISLTDTNNANRKKKANLQECYLILVMHIKNQ